MSKQIGFSKDLDNTKISKEEHLARWEADFRPAPPADDFVPAKIGGYPARIMDALGCTEKTAALVEGSMRANLGTLDHLSATAFKAAAHAGLDEINSMGIDMAVRLAESYGIKIPTVHAEIVETPSPVDRIVSTIALRKLGVGSFDEIGSDRADFVEVARGSVRDALLEAFARGRDFETNRASKKKAEPKAHRPAVWFDDTEYLFNHGSAPRGRGSWAFVFREGESVRVRNYTNEEIWWTPGGLTFTEAKRLARAEAVRRFPGAGAVTVGVCS